MKNLFIIFYFNILNNRTYFIKTLKLFKKYSTSFKDWQVFFFKDLKLNFLGGGKFLLLDDLLFIS